MDDFRCLNCDSRYCTAGCEAREGSVYVPGKGWATPAEAKALEAQGRTVNWNEVWTEAEGGHILLIEPNGHPHHPEGFCTVATCAYSQSLLPTT
jgi:hypothetical protein